MLRLELQTKLYVEKQHKNAFMNIAMRHTHTHTERYLGVSGKKNYDDDDDDSLHMCITLTVLV